MKYQKIRAAYMIKQKKNRVFGKINHVIFIITSLTEIRLKFIIND